MMNTTGRGCGAGMQRSSSSPSPSTFPLGMGILCGGSGTGMCPQPSALNSDIALIDSGAVRLSYCILSHTSLLIAIAYTPQALRNTLPYTHKLALPTPLPEVSSHAPKGHAEGLFLRSCAHLSLTPASPSMEDLLPHKCSSCLYLFLGCC